MACKMNNQFEVPNVQQAEFIAGCFPLKSSKVYRAGKTIGKTSRTVNLPNDIIVVR